MQFAYPSNSRSSFPDEISIMIRHYVIHPQDTPPLDDTPLCDTPDEIHASNKANINNTVC